MYACYMIYHVVFGNLIIYSRLLYSLGVLCKYSRAGYHGLCLIPHAL